MTITAIRQKLHGYIDTADDKKVEAIYSMLEGDIIEKFNHWDDEEFLNELNSRLKDIESGNAKFSTWEEVKLKARSR